MHEERTARREPDLIPDVIVPALQAFGTGLLVLLGVGLLAWALAWSWRVPVALGGLAWVIAWFWRLGIVTSLLWAVETWTQHDLDNDHTIGKPQVSYGVVNPGQARAAVAAREAQAEADERKRRCWRLRPLLHTGLLRECAGHPGIGSRTHRYVTQRTCCYRWGWLRGAIQTSPRPAGS